MKRYKDYPHTAFTNSGKISPDLPRNAKSVFGVSGVGSALISTTTEPLFLAACANAAAGWTTPDVPMEKNICASRAALTADSNSARGSASPNQTTSGRSKPSHASHLGTDSLSSPQISVKVPQSAQRTLRMLPCNSSTFLLPANRCNPSTFWVISVKVGNLFSISTRA